MTTGPLRALFVGWLAVHALACTDDDRPDARLPLGPEIDAPLEMPDAGAGAGDAGALDAQPADADVAD